MLAAAAYDAATSELFAMGGLYEAQALVYRPTSIAGAQAVFERARRSG